MRQERRSLVDGMLARPPRMFRSRRAKAAKQVRGAWGGAHAGCATYAVGSALFAR